MTGVQIVWDLEDNPKGNYRHILDSHEVTIEEVEQVLLDPNSVDAVSRSSGYPITFGWTDTGKYIAVVWENVQDDPKIIYPITAYPVPSPGERTKRRRRR